jgi:hypothetical protein
MWSVWLNSILYTSGSDFVSFPVFSPDWSSFQGMIFSPSLPDISPGGFDDWVQQFPLEQEISLVQGGIARAKHGERIHIRGVSSSLAVELLREYYTAQGYRDQLDRFSIPPEESLTVSISLPHFLWCDKDKEFLQKNTSFYQISPPLRTSHDLRQIQQAVRMGVIPCIEIGAESAYLSESITRELIPLFQLGQACRYNWEKYGFSGDEQRYSMNF